jgi:hypothetical protein
MYISLYDLGLFILFFIALGVGFYLIATLRAVLGVVTQVRGVIENQREALEETIEVLPELLTNSNEVVLGLRKTVETTSSAVSYLEGNITDTVDRVQETAETALVYARCVADVIKAVMSSFSRSSDK